MQQSGKLNSLKHEQTSSSEWVFIYNKQDIFISLNIKYLCTFYSASQMFQNQS